MMRFLLCSAAFLTLLSPPLHAEAGAEAESDALPAECRAKSLEVAGAFTNDGFKIRDGHVVNRISPASPALVQVNLYAGNQYWFIATATDSAEGITVSLFDEGGKPIPYEPFQDGLKAAAGFSPTVSGPYYVRVETKGPEATFCLIYCYK